MALVIEQQGISVLPSGRVTPKEAAKFLGVSVNTLANWRVQRRGPPFKKQNSRVLYEYSELAAWEGDRGERDMNAPLSNAIV